MTRSADTGVLLADYPGMARTALARLVSDIPGVALLAKVSLSEEIEPAVREWRPDVVVVDDRLLRDPRWTGPELGARLVVVGVDDDPAYPARARRLGAEAWIPKDRADTLLPLTLAAQPELTWPDREPAAPAPAGAGRESSP